MVLKVDLSANASVRLVCVDGTNTGAAYLANLYIPIFTLDGKIIHRYEVPNQIVGLAFHPNKNKVLYAIDDSFGMHVFDIRSDSKKKLRLNPDVENHCVVCTAISSENMIAISSSEFGGGILDVRGSRRREHHPHVVSLFDIRNTQEPITTYNKRHGAEITSMDFYKNGNDLLTGDKDGALKSFNCQLRDEDNAVRWERWAKGPITKVGVINKRIVYGVSNRSEACVFVDSKGNLETLYGVVNESADDPIDKTSKAFYKKPEFCVGLIKGVNDAIPLVAVHGVEGKDFLSLTAMNQQGVRQEKPLLSYPGHTGEVKCMTVSPELLLTGGEDGKVCIQISNFKNPEFGKDCIDHYRLTLNRQNLAALQDAKGDSDSDEDDKDKEEKVSSESSDSESEADGPSTSTASSSKSKSSSSKKTKNNSKPSTSASSSSSKAESKESKEDRDARKEKEAKEKEKAEKKAKKEEAEKKAKKEEAEKKAKKEEAEKKAKKQEAEKKAKKEEAERKAKKEKAKDEERKREEAKKKEKAKKEETKKESPKKSESRKEESKKDESKKKERDESKKRDKEDADKKQSTETKEEQALKDAAEVKRLAEREARRKMKEAETKEERAARKDRERKERQEAQEREDKARREKEREERKKKHNGEGPSSSGSSAKKPKHK